MVNKKYDWEEVERYFMAGNDITLRDVSERFNIPYQTVRRYAGNNEWHSKRYRAWIKEKHGMDFEDHLRTVYEEVMNNR